MAAQYNTSFVLGVEDNSGFGVLQLFEVSKHLVGSDGSSMWADARNRARAAAERARDRWTSYYERLPSKSKLVIREMECGSCDAVVNK